MRPNLKRFVAALVGAATLLTPVSAFAGDYCSTYHQVQSSATGGQYVGGLLMYEAMGEVERTSPEVTTTTSTTSNTELGIPGSSVGTGTTFTVTVKSDTEKVTTEEPFGYYKMNDGSVYRVNCITGKATQLS